MSEARMELRNAEAEAVEHLADHAETEVVVHLAAVDQAEVEVAEHLAADDHEVVEEIVEPLAAVDHEVNEEIVEHLAAADHVEAEDAVDHEVVEEIVEPLAAVDHEVNEEIVEHLAAADHVEAEDVEHLTAADHASATKKRKKRAGKAEAKKRKKNSVEYWSKEVEQTFDSDEEGWEWINITKCRLVFRNTKGNKLSTTKTKVPLISFYFKCTYVLYRNFVLKYFWPSGTVVQETVLKNRKR
jgi:hypothetical protein